MPMRSSISSAPCKPHISMAHILMTKYQPDNDGNAGPNRGHQAAFPSPPLANHRVENKRTLLLAPLSASCPPARSPFALQSPPPNLLLRTITCESEIDLVDPALS